MSDYLKKTKKSLIRKLHELNLNETEAEVKRSHLLKPIFSLPSFRLVGAREDI